MSEKTKRKPDYKISALNKRTDEKGTVGAAWLNENGTISIVLDPFVTLTQTGKDLLLTLFPADGRSKDRSPPEDSGEIPF
jgi:hypothetical protein